jgi:peptide/nickel transport system ATP-binding protein
MDMKVLGGEPLLCVTDVSKTYLMPGTIFRPGRTLNAVEQVSLALNEAEILGIVGESGSGKTTLSKMILGITTLTQGSISLNGRPLQSYDRKQRALLMQPVFQDPYSSLNPRRDVGEIIRQPLDVHGVGTSAEREKAVDQMLDVVRLPKRTRTALPSQLSGGQRQRVAIARALVLRPRIVVCDEPTSALDVSVQAQILNLLMDLRSEFRLGMLFVSHNLAVVRHMADNVAVMRRGRIVDYGTAEDVFTRPSHEYTRSLLAAILTLPQADGTGGPSFETKQQDS